MANYEFFCSMAQSLTTMSHNRYNRYSENNGALGFYYIY